MSEIPRRCQLSPAVIAGLPTTGTRYVVRDLEVPGLAVRVYPSGTKAYTLDFRVAGDRAKYRMSLGTFPEVPLSKARIAAKAAKASARADRRNPVTERAEEAAKRAAARDAARAVRQQAAAAEKERVRHSVYRLASDYIRDHAHRLKPSTVSLYRSTLRYLTGDFGRRALASLTQTDVRELLRIVQDGQRPAGMVAPARKARRIGGIGAARTLRRFLSTVWRYAHEEREIVTADSPVPSPARVGLVEREKERFLTEAECARVFRAIDTAATVGLPAAPHRKRSPKDGDTARHRPKSADAPIQANPVAVAALRFALHTGWRRGEVLSLEWDMLRRDLGVVILTDTKTGESVRAPSAAAWDILETVPRVVGSPYVFPSSRGKDHHKPLRDVSRLWDAVRHAAGLHDTRFHDLRHTAASLALNAGASLEEVQSMLDHQSIRSTMRYAKLIPSTGLRASEKLAGVLAAAAKAPVAPVLAMKRAKK